MCNRAVLPVQLLTTAAATLGGSCSTSINGTGATDGSTDDDIPEDTFSCQISAVGKADRFVENATVDLMENVTALACEENLTLMSGIMAQV